MSGWDKPTLAGGIVLLAVSVAFAVAALRMSVGTAQLMGPGYFPLVVAIILGLLSVGVIALARGRDVAFPMPEFRPLFWVLASTAVFALTLRNVGLVPSIFLTILVASFADRTSRLVPALILGVAIALAAWFVFIVLLGLPLAAWRSPL
jgi:hypothetical protein